MAKVVCSKKWGNSEYLIADESDAIVAKGQEELRLALGKMPVVKLLIDRFTKEQPFKGKTIAACLHVTKETANLCRAWKAGGAKVYICGSNPLSTQDDTAAALCAEGIHVFAWHGTNSEDFYKNIRSCLVPKPNIIVDDGADLIVTAHKEFPQYFTDGTVIACQEETTTGVKRFEAMDKAGALKTSLFPVNNASCKNEFDNELGTGQGIVAAIIGLHVLFAGKVVVIGGFGHCSMGMAKRARGLGARVIVTEIDPVKALQAVFDGYEVMPMADAVKQADMIFTATGCKNVVEKKHIPTIKDGCILANLGHFDVEIMAKDFYAAAKDKKIVRPNVEEITFADGRRVFLLAEGRLANLAISEGHPSEIMDMSFGLQALVGVYIVKNAAKFKGKAGMVKVPEEINDEVALLKLNAMNIKIDKLTKEQYDYTHGFEEGT